MKHYRTTERKFHLDASQAKKLIAMVLKTYQEKHGSPPKELFIHGRTWFYDVEWEVSLLKSPSGHGIGLPMKASVDDVR